jgi:hypothetical protein
MLRIASFARAESAQSLQIATEAESAVVSILVSIIPANRAARITVREALAGCWTAL